MKTMNIKTLVVIVLFFSYWAGAQGRIESQAAVDIIENAWNIINSE